MFCVVFCDLKVPGQIGKEQLSAGDNGVTTGELRAIVCCPPDTGQ